MTASPFLLVRVANARVFLSFLSREWRSVALAARQWDIGEPPMPSHERILTL